MTVTGLDPGLRYRFNVRATCKDEGGATLNQTKVYGSGTLLVAPGYIPQAPWGHVTGTGDKIKFHALPNSICDGFMLEYRHSGQEWNRQYVSNAYPGSSDWHDDFWMYQLDNADTKYDVGRIHCVHENAGTDAEPDYRTTSMLPSTTFRYED